VRDTRRLLRGGLLALVAGVLASVVWTLQRRPTQVVDASPSPSAGQASPGSPPPQSTRMSDLVYVSQKAGKQNFELRAKKMTGREQEEIKLQVVQMDFVYVSHGEPGKGQIVSDECVYFPARQEAFFQGHVRLTTADGVDLTTDQLIYDGQQGRANSPKPVGFKKKDLSGRALSMSYDANGGELQLDGEVFLRSEDEREGALEIESARAVFRREQGEAEFTDEVKLRRGADQLSSAKLILYGGEDELRRFKASGDVVVNSSGTALPGAPAAKRSTGSRELRSQVFEVSLRADRTLEEAVARDDAVLVVLPGPGQARERKTLKGSVLTFRWDDKGRLSELLGQKDTEFVGEPLPPDKSPPRSVKSRNFQALFEPETGAVNSVEFNKDVEFERGPQKARSNRGYYDGKESKLMLNEEPTLRDTEQGSRLEAEAIELFTESGDARARHGVRHTLERGAGAAPGMLGGDETAVISARNFQYEAKSHTARYREGALLRSGKSELRATEIRRIDPGPGQRRLEASGDVVTLMFPRAKPGEPERKPIDARAQEMTYEESKRRLSYKGDAVLTQAEVRTKSPEAVLLLSKDGGELERLEAFDPVELIQDKRTATGQRAVYTPADKTIVVTGQKVELKDEAQQVQGRSLTFFVGDDRILVDGREEARTETILRKK
jgi:LPS export ABC transporter protein LptC/lipopolysaccharide transport protein LptA